MSSLKPQLDTRHAQFERVADYLEANPGSTLKQIDAACDLGSPTKVISEMRRTGYGLRITWQYEACVRGSKLRQVNAYDLLARPRDAQRSLFPAS